MRLVNRLWYGGSPWAWLIRPFSLLYYLAIVIRRGLYRLSIFKSERLPVPVIVVGNITAGGTGKTPMVLWLVDYLQARGFTPGIISRGYGGKRRHSPCEVTADSDPSEAGDEPVMLAARSACPVFVFSDRVACGHSLLEKYPDVDVIVADDGLQHFRLARDAEIVIIDAARGLGNGFLLPAGPLRESSRRLRHVDLVLANGGGPYGLSMELIQEQACSYSSGRQRSLESFQGEPVHALAGIGNPERFFDQLAGYGIIVLGHPFPDHYRFRRNDLDFGDQLDILMTEKDAVKCRSFANDRHWYIPVHAHLESKAVKCIDEIIERIRDGKGTA